MCATFTKIGYLTNKINESNFWKNFVFLLQLWWYPMYSKRYVEHLMNHNNRRIPKHRNKWIEKRTFWFTWICDFFSPDAGSLIGILTVSCSLETTIERRDEYCVWITLSSTDQKRWNASVFSYLNNSIESLFHQFEFQLPSCGIFHFIIRHISNDMINKIKFNIRSKINKY